jgi:hypothetical protein
LQISTGLFDAFDPENERAGHEYLKCQLERRGIDYEALDNGISWCEDLPAAQRICAHFDQQKIEAFFRKWLRRLPHPFSAQDRRLRSRQRILL